MGLQNFPYLFAIFLVQCVTGLLTSLIMTGVGTATQIPFFAKSNFGIIVLFFWLIKMAVSGYALWLGSWIHRPTVNSSSLPSLLLPFAANDASRHST